MGAEGDVAANSCFCSLNLIIRAKMITCLSLILHFLGHWILRSSDEGQIVWRWGIMKTTSRLNYKRIGKYRGKTVSLTWKLFGGFQALTALRTFNSWMQYWKSYCYFICKQIFKLSAYKAISHSHWVSNHEDFLLRIIWVILCKKHW